jgi:hypothetical protein
VIELAVQVYIFGTAALALACLTQLSPRRRFAGFVIGLAGQPGWLLSTWWAGQWGLFAAALLYTGLYAHGIWTHHGRLK